MFVFAELFESYRQYGSLKNNNILYNHIIITSKKINNSFVSEVSNSFSPRAVHESPWRFCLNVIGLLNQGRKNRGESTRLAQNLRFHLSNKISMGRHCWGSTDHTFSSKAV